jgi:nucleoside phosphorylase
VIGILAYSYSDVATIMENATILNQKKIGNVTYYLVNINGNQVYVILVGAGKVNVAIGLMYALVKLCIKKVIVVGNAASLNEEEYPIGSVAIATGSLEWDVNYINLGYPANVVPGNTVSIYPTDSTLLRKQLMHLMD